MFSAEDKQVRDRRLLACYECFCKVNVQSVPPVPVSHRFSASFFSGFIRHTRLELWTSSFLRGTDWTLFVPARW
jgi:hypothetical protein